VYEDRFDLIFQFLVRDIVSRFIYWKWIQNISHLLRFVCINVN